MSQMLLQVLSESEMEQLHERTLDVFESPGVRVAHGGVLDRLAKAGCKTDASGIVRFPRRVIEEALAQAPSEVRLTGLDGRELLAGGGNRYYTSLVTDPYVVDRRTGPRPPVLEDVRCHTIVGQSLDRIDAMTRMQQPVEDIPGPLSCLKTLEVFLCHCSKHMLALPDSVENARQWIGALEVLLDGKDLRRNPVLTLGVPVTSPLTLHGMNVDLLEIGLRYNLPIMPTVCPMAGTTAPYTLAGTMLMANVEALLMTVLVQVLKPGHPVFYGLGPSETDLRTGHDLYYKAEKMLFKTMAAQMGRFYGLPVTGECGGSMTWRYDPQNGAEGMMYLLASVAGGQHLINGVGSCHNANGMSAEEIVIQCGMIEMAEYVAKGVHIDERDLGLESIRAAGPGGQFLGDDLTLEYMRKSQFFSTSYFDYAGGYVPSSGCVAMAEERVDQIIDDYDSSVAEARKEKLRPYFEGLAASIAR